jgi:hypothetical protein
MLTAWLWRTIRPKPLAALAILAIWTAASALLWFLLYPALGPLIPLAPTNGAGINP